MQSIADAGVRIVVAGGKISELALHYANKLGIMLVRLMSKWDVRRLCQATNATILPALTVPTPEELGYIERVHVEEIADANVVVFEQGVCPFKDCLNFINTLVDNFLNRFGQKLDGDCHSSW